MTKQRRLRRHSGECLLISFSYREENEKYSRHIHCISYSYTFTGAPQSTIEEYNGITKRTDYTYDERCRLISETTTINDSAPATITYSYDALGKLISKTYGNGVTETINYNIQGWQTATEVTNGSTNIYSQQLKYYNPTKGSTPLYTGNISEWSTTMGTQAMNTYGFEYDKLGRLKNTLHYSSVATTPTAAYTERGITYDLNGNITTLKRYAASEATPEDDYQYIYTGNKLTQIAGTDNNATISNVTYTYDSNGNMTSDGLKNLQISYNFLNLPSVVTQDDIPVAEYSWFADGSKYRVLDESNNGYYYIGSLIYASNNGNLQIESTDFTGGRINLAQTGSAASGTNNTGSTLTQDIHYFHTDHLGSVRAITNQNGETVEQNAYYPFGSRHTFGNTYAQTTNRFKFNGKEEQTTGNLNYLDYGARMHDSNIGRWMVQDPLAEKYYSQSPYNYCVNNPVMFVDPDGKDVNLSYMTAKNHIEALDKLLQTSEGYEFISRYMKKGQTLSVNGNNYHFEIDGDRAKDILYIQLIGYDLECLNSDTFRVFKKSYSVDYSPTIDEILKDDIDFYVHSFASGGIHDGIWNLVYRSKDVGKLDDIKFRSIGELPPPRMSFSEYVFSKSRVWTFNGNDSYLICGKLPKKWEGAYDGGVLQPENILYRIKYGKFRSEPRYKE